MSRAIGGFFKIKVKVRSSNTESSTGIIVPILSLVASLNWVTN
jgi:hypothetical protein